MAKPPNPLVAAATVALVGLAVVLAWALGRSDDAPIEQTTDTLRLGYRVEPSGAAAAEQTAQAVRARLAAAGIDDARVSVSSSASLTIIAPAAARADVTALVQRGRFAIYDWERSVLSPRRVPTPTDESATGGPDAGRIPGITKAQADARVAGPSGGRVVSDVGNKPDRWLVLGGEPIMTDADIESARSGKDAMTGEPIVTIEFTARGRDAAAGLTRDFAHRARRARAKAAAGASDVEAGQHFAMVIDDQIVAMPFMDYDFRPASDSIINPKRAQIQGNLTPQTARRIAAILSTGPLPAALSTPKGQAPQERHP
jgi:preprotein translocase subunit SecD